MASIKVLLKKNKESANNLIPLYLRIIKDRKVKYVSIGHNVNPKYWNELENKVKKSHPNAQYLNNFIAHKIAEAERIILELEIKSQPISSVRIKESLLGKSYTDFFVYAEKFLDSLSRSGKIGTYRSYIGIISKLKLYCQNKALLFDDITVTFLSQYEDYLRNNLNNKTNTIYSNFKVIRKIFSNAIKEDLFPYEKNPFLKFSFTKEPGVRDYLTEDELKQIENLKLEPGTMMFHHCNSYIFSAYTGIRISDLLQLKWKNFDGDHIIFKIQKTGNTISIKLPNKALDIINSYDNKNSNPDDYIFPMLKNSRSQQDLFNRISSATAHTNKNLKIIARKEGIDKNVTFHTSRHTWATRALRKGIRIEYVSKLLGHTDGRKTQIYSRIVNEELDKAMEVFDVEENV